MHIWAVLLWFVWNTELLLYGEIKCEQGWLNNAYLISENIGASCAVRVDRLSSSPLPELDIWSRWFFTGIVFWKYKITPRPRSTSRLQMTCHNSMLSPGLSKQSTLLLQNPPETFKSCNTIVSWSRWDTFKSDKYLGMVSTDKMSVGYVLNFRLISSPNWNWLLAEKVKWISLLDSIYFLTPSPQCHFSF